ncbi:MAG: hypothetical protein ACE5EH_11750 [Gammaproteobacteria bacterium]
MSIKTTSKNTTCFNNLSFSPSSLHHQLLTELVAPFPTRPRAVTDSLGSYSSPELIHIVALISGLNDLAAHPTVARMMFTGRLLSPSPAPPQSPFGDCA